MAQDVSFKKRFSPSFISRVARKPEDRVPTVTGADAVIEAQGDIKIGPSGDISVVTGAECVITGLLRRLGTPPAGYRRFVKTPAGVVAINTTYLDGLYDYLSGPLTTNNLSQMRAALKTAADLDGRVVITDVEAGTFNYASNTVALSVTYRVKSTSELNTVQLFI